MCQLDHVQHSWRHGLPTSTAAMCSSCIFLLGFWSQAAIGTTEEHLTIAALLLSMDFEAVPCGLLRIQDLHSFFWGICIQVSHQKRIACERADVAHAVKSHDVEKHNRKRCCLCSGFLAMPHDAKSSVFTCSRGLEAHTANGRRLTKR